MELSRPKRKKTKRGLRRTKQEFHREYLLPIIRRIRKEFCEMYPDAEEPAIYLLSDAVLVRLIAPERIVHGLYIPDTAKRRPDELWRAVVLACGPGKRGELRQIPNEANPNPAPIFTDRVTPCQAQPGDTVLFHWAAGKILITAWPDERHRIIRDEQIQAVIE